MNIFTHPNNYELNIQNIDDFNSENISFTLFESFVNYKKNNLLIVNDTDLDEFINLVDSDESLLAELNIRNIQDDTITSYVTGENAIDYTAHISAIHTSKLILSDKITGKNYDFSIKDGVLDVNTI